MWKGDDTLVITRERIVVVGIRSSGGSADDGDGNKVGKWRDRKTVWIAFQDGRTIIRTNRRSEREEGDNRKG